MNFFPALSLLIESLPPATVVRTEPGALQIEVKPTVPMITPARLLQMAKKAATLGDEDLLHIRELLNIVAVTGQGAVVDSVQLLFERFRRVTRRRAIQAMPPRTLTRHLWLCYGRLFKAMGYEIASSERHPLYFAHHFPRFGLTVSFSRAPARQVSAEIRVSPRQILRQRGPRLLQEVLSAGSSLFPWEVIGFVPVYPEESREAAELPPGVRADWRRILKTWCFLSAQTGGVLQAQDILRTGTPTSSKVVLKMADAATSGWKLPLCSTRFSKLGPAAQVLRRRLAKLPSGFETLKSLVAAMGYPPVQRFERTRAFRKITFSTAPERETTLKTVAAGKTQRWNLLIRTGGLEQSKGCGLTLRTLRRLLLRQQLAWRYHARLVQALDEVIEAEGEQSKELRNYKQPDGKGFLPWVVSDARQFNNSGVPKAHRRMETELTALEI